MKNKAPSWIDVKKQIKKFDKQQLIDLVRDLYQLSSDNKIFFNTRFSLGEDPLETYKQIIQNSMNPSLEDNEILNIKIANKSIKSYSKAVDKPKGEAELMIFYVECGNNFTLSYGDIDEDFYDSVLDMYELAIETVQELPIAEQKDFRERLYEIMESGSGIVWGYSDGLSGLYHKAFPGEV
ncbi:MAG: DUF6155 family protein [Desulfobacula sp.]|jgi:hypothetical protein|nr:DUF6155 family protein [Desulfobacula sp.]